MIAWLEGTLRERSPTRVVVDVGGVGYELAISLSTFEGLPDTGKTIALHVHTVMRESSLQLFGFGTREERAVFQLLLKANRVGPKLAQAILSGVEPGRLLRALRDGDAKLLRGAPGVGPKLAERMVVELRDPASELALGIGAGDGLGVSELEDATASAPDELLSALVNLGYPRSQAERVVDATVAAAPAGAALEELIRIALRRLSR